MSTRRALLAAVRAQPDEDTPRLALADFLDEEGDPQGAEWATLIRLQIAAARSEVGSDGHGEAVWREAEHQRACLDRWRADRAARGVPSWDFRTGPLFSWVGPLPPDLAAGTFERGMPTSVGRRAGNYTEWTLTAGHRKAIAAVVRQLPVTRLVSPVVGRAAHLAGAPFVQGGRTVLEILAGWPTLENFAGLDVRHAGHLGDDQSRGLHALAESPFAANLTKLGVAGAAFGGVGWPDVFDSPNLPKLESLAARTEGGAAPLAFLPVVGSAFARRCRSLVAEGAGVPPAVVGGVVTVGKVERLALNVDGFPPDAFATALAAASARQLARLRSLRVVYDGPAELEDRSPELTEVTPAPALLALLASPHLTGLTELSLEGIAVRERGVKALAASPVVRRLHSLELRRCALNDHCVRALLPLLAEGRLRKLRIDDNALTAAAARRLAKWPELKRLHDLRLPGREMGRGALDGVANSPHANPFLMLSE